jgi:uncharacterized protein (TIGR03118 family)
MKLVRKLSSTRARATAVAALLAIPLAAAPGVAAAGNDHRTGPAFAEVDLVSDIAGRAAVTDPHVVNAWGLALSATSPLWVVNNGTDAASLAAGGLAGAPPTIPALVVAVAGAPTGEAFNGGTQFVVTGPSGSGPARFLFDTEGGDLLAWNPAASPTTAISVSHVDGAVYKGLAMASNEFGSFLLATDFHNARIDVFDSLFRRTNLPAPLFTDPRLPRGYAPFNVDFLDGHAYVAYAKVDAATGRNQPGRGLGFVDVFNRFGQLERRLASHGTLNSPWGFEIAPASFGAFAGDLLVGNFGDGRIHAFRKGEDGWEEHGVMKGTDHQPIEIDGLWGIGFGNNNGTNNGAAGPTTTLFFAAGPDDETHGLFGSITAP